ncbi:MAG: biopolymer transporter ExbD [Flavobacteriales bacterium]|nr:MAG: biopolymer transporter ExbD [Flavobacteriales bacterium]
MSIQTRNKVSTQFSMASMTDIVFLLLIFFIILSTLINPFAENLDLPNSETRTTSKPEVSITITADLEYKVNGKTINPMAVEQEMLAALQGKAKRQAVLNVDETVPTGFTINIFALARKHNVDMVVATEAN